MLVGWRIIKRRYAANAFDGEGARRYGGRWTSPGIPVVHLSGSLALATLEILVNLQDDGPLPAYVSYRVEFAEELVEAVGDLPDGWSSHPPPAETRALGDDWVRRGSSVLLRVPSVVLPGAGEWNYLANPAHPRFAEVRIASTGPLPLDPRLVRRPG